MTTAASSSSSSTDASSFDTESFFLLETESTDLQQETLLECLPFLIELKTLPQDQIEHLQQVGLLQPDNTEQLCLVKAKHSAYLSRPLVSHLNHSFVSLDASRPWILYWTVHGLDLMNQLERVDSNILNGIVSTLEACWNGMTVMTIDDEIASSPMQEGGGFGGGPGQIAHCAPTYAAVMVLAILISVETSRSNALALLQKIRMPLYHWFLTLKRQDGGYCMHQDGEVDVRATYTMLACASLLNLPTRYLVNDATIHFVLDCQTYEGGFGGEPYNEAHGGYTYCAVAALELVNATSKIRNLHQLRTWLAQRQMSVEGGFQGRANKLVDGCYSFWQGAGMTILSRYFDSNTNKATAKQPRADASGGGYDPNQDYWLRPPQETSSGSSSSTTHDELNVFYSQDKLQRYILTCAQDVRGGLRDKPSKPRDFYHTCYNLSGLSVAQHYGNRNLGTLSYGHPIHSRVAKTHLCFNIRVDRLEQALPHFYPNQKQQQQHA